MTCSIAVSAGAQLTNRLFRSARSLTKRLLKTRRRGNAQYICPALCQPSRCLCQPYQQASEIEWNDMQTQGVVTSIRTLETGRRGHNRWICIWGSVLGDYQVSHRRWLQCLWQVGKALHEAFVVLWFVPALPCGWSPFWSLIACRWAW